MARIRSYAQETPLVYLPSHDPDSTQRLAAHMTVALAE